MSGTSQIQQVITSHHIQYVHFLTELTLTPHLMQFPCALCVFPAFIKLRLTLRVLDVLHYVFGGAVVD